MAKALKYLLIFTALAASINSQWVKVSNGMGNNVTVEALTSGGNYLFAGTYGQGVFSSTDYGSTWIRNIIYPQYIYSLIVKDNIVFAGTYIEGVYTSTDFGSTWAYSGLNNNIVWSLCASGNNIFAGTYQNGIFVTSDNGTGWSNSGYIYQTNIYGLLSSGGIIYAGANGVFRSSNSGYTWDLCGVNNQTIGPLTSNINCVFAGAGFSMGVYKSTTNGLSWCKTGLNYRTIYSLASSGNNIFAGTDVYGVYVSNDNGETWTEKNEGLGYPAFVNALCIKGNYIFAGLSNRSVYRRSLDELVGINPVNSNVPAEYTLYQNFPNPFNPVTNIRFNIPVSGEVKIEVFDQLGSLISVPVNEHLGPGVYETKWNAGNNSSGIYFYRLTSGKFTGTKKMILLK